MNEDGRVSARFTNVHFQQNVSSRTEAALFAAGGEGSAFSCCDRGCLAAWTRFPWFLVGARHVVPALYSGYKSCQMTMQFPTERFSGIAPAATSPDNSGAPACVPCSHFPFFPGTIRQTKESTTLLYSTISGIDKVLYLWYHNS